MKLKCRKDYLMHKGFIIFKKGSWYEVISEKTASGDFYYTMICDKGLEFSFYNEINIKDHFCTNVEELRESEINEIINK
jgi:hypothetical protein